MKNIVSKCGSREDINNLVVSIGHHLNMGVLDVKEVETEDES